MAASSEGSASRAKTRVLFHSYHFPPIGGSGVLRPLKLVRTLRETAYEPIVVTSGGGTRDRWAPEDASLVAQIPPGLDIRRVPDVDEPRTRGTGLDGFAERWLGRPGPWSRWWTDASLEVSLDVPDVDLVYVWMQPYASAVTGAALSRELGKPWVADLGDPWALDEMMVYPSRIHRQLATRRMRRLLRTAAAIVLSTPEAARRVLEAFPELSDRPVVVIPNGFDRSDFEEPIAPRDDDRFRIVHTGYLHTELGRLHRRRRVLRRALGGSVRHVDILTRSHIHLVAALNRLIASSPALEQTLELHLAGVLSEADRAMATANCTVVLHGFATHAESVDLMRTADLLFLPMQNLPPGTRATIVPGKTYEYLAAGRPILAAVPDGDARDILAQAGNALLVRPDDVAGMASVIAAQVERLQRRAPAPAPDAALIGQFEYTRLAEELTRVFDTVLRARSEPLLAAQPAAQDGATNQA